MKTTIRPYGWLLTASIAAALACGAAGPRQQVLLTPHPVPFGTAGLSDIPARPSFAARLKHPLTPCCPNTPAPTSSPGELWRSSAMAEAAIASFRPAMPDETEASSFFTLSTQNGCAALWRFFGVRDVEAAYRAARGAVLESGFTTERELGRQHDGPLALTFSAIAPAMTAEISVGSSAVGAGIIPRTRLPYLVEVRFVQRC